MAVVIRLKRIGAKKDPVFRIVVADSRAARDGRFIDQIGFYNAQPREAEFKVDAERARYWLSVGAQPSDQVRSLFRKSGVAMPVRQTKSRKQPAGAGAAGGAVAAKAAPTTRRRQSGRTVQRKKRAQAKAARPRAQRTKKAATKTTTKK